MYLQNKYTKWYYSIINSVSNKNLSEYTEKHHIIPRSLGGNNAGTNLVRLIPREHFICHKLLTKMVEGKSKSKMMYAYRALAIINPPNRPKFKINSKEFEKLRTLGLRTGVIVSAETKKKISIAKKQQNVGAGNPMYGKTHSTAARAQISSKRKERASDPTWNIRPPCSEEKANKIRESNIGRKWVHKPVTKERKNISPEEFFTYCNSGWIPGNGTF